MNFLITGGAGFIGSNFIQLLIQNAIKTNECIKIVNLDKLTYAGNLESLKDIEKNSNYKFYKFDICCTGEIGTPIEEQGGFDRDKFDKLTSLTTGLIHNSVFKIDSDQTSTDNLQFIKEFLENADKDIFDAIKAHIETMRLRNTLKPLKITPTPEMIEAGVPDKELEIPLVFDASTFFV